MILGVGTDIVATERIKKLLEQFGPRFVTRILTEHERDRWEEHAQGDDGAALQYFARRFAAKEAVAKALGTGIGASASFQDIEVRSRASGQPVVTLTGAAKTTLSQRAGANKTAIHLSLADEKDTAIAFAVIEENLVA